MNLESLEDDINSPDDFPGASELSVAFRSAAEKSSLVERAFPELQSVPEFVGLGREYNKVLIEYELLLDSVAQNVMDDRRLHAVVRDLTILASIFDGIYQGLRSFERAGNDITMDSVVGWFRDYWQWLLDELPGDAYHGLETINQKRAHWLMSHLSEHPSIDNVYIAGSAVKRISDNN